MQCEETLVNFFLESHETHHLSDVNKVDCYINDCEWKAKFATSRQWAVSFIPIKTALVHSENKTDGI
jgi:hypothetical protein